MTDPEHETQEFPSEAGDGASSRARPKRARVRKGDGTAPEPALGAETPGAGGEGDDAEIQADDSTTDAFGAEDSSPENGAREDDAIPELSDRELDRAIEAMLFAVAEPLTALRMAQALLTSQRRIHKAIERLRDEYTASERAFDVREIAGGFKLYTRPEHQDIVARLEKVRPPEKLSASALETLAIIAYRQPIVRVEVDSIRGVQCGAILKSLTERKLIRVTGRSEQPGRPMQYGTTKRFLDHFGLKSLDDLPRVEDLKAPKPNGTT